jgi:hypothetical protein
VCVCVCVQELYLSALTDESEKSRCQNIVEIIEKLNISCLVIGPGLMAMAASTSETAAGTCTFTSRNYAVGDVWYPRLGQREALHCVACICQEVNTKMINSIFGSLLKLLKLIFKFQFDIWFII